MRLNSKIFTLWVIILGLLLTSLVTKSGDLAWMTLPFLAYLGIGILQTPTAGSVRLDATRLVSTTGFEHGSTADMEIMVCNQGEPLNNLFLRDHLPQGIHITKGQPYQRLALQHGEETIVRYSFQQDRGQYSWETVQAVASDPFGLFSIQLSLPARVEHNVKLTYSKFQRLNIRPRGTLHMPGSIPAHLAGSGTDFWGIREYHPGDPLRWLDWRLIARHPHQYYTKEFEQEEIADIGLILDARQKSYLQIGEDELFEHAVSAAGSLAEAFLHQGHRVSLLALNETIVSIYPGYGKVQLNHILRCLSTVKTGSYSSNSRLNDLPLRMFSSHALLIVISPWIHDELSFFKRLRASGYQALLISPDPLDFSASLFTKDRESQLAFRVIRLERRLKLREITQLQTKVIDWPVSQSLYPLVRGAISHSRGQREI